MKLSELTSKEIINNLDGSKVGKIVDLEFDESGKVTNVILCRGSRLIGIFKKDYFNMEWSKIIKIGNDVIIVSDDYLGEQGPKEQKS